MRQLAVSLVLFAVAASAPPQTPSVVDYRFDEVKRKVTLTSANQELRVERGQKAQSGDRVQTGWLSYALIASDRYRAKFELFSSTDVKLSEGTPGVILSLERGKLRAAFDKITGNEPRIVKTPGALLAVRGTKYDVEVDDAGATTVRVFEGIVQVDSEFRREPLFIPAGQMTHFGRREAPEMKPIPQERRPGDDRSRDPRNGNPDDHGRNGMTPPTDGRGMPGGMPPPPNSPPPSPPPGGHH